MNEWKKRVYSGICVCGHEFQDHHLSMVMNKQYYDTTGEPYIGEECEFYGWNETGGLNFDGSYHCQRFIDKDDPEADAKIANELEYEKENICLD